MTGEISICKDGSNMKTIGVFFGSRSVEHDISIITAQLIISGLKGLNYNVVPIYIGKGGSWLIDEKFGELKNFTQPKSSSDNSNYKKFYLDLENSRGKIVFKKKGVTGKSIAIDIAFPAFHGTYGEDGTFQGVFETVNIPYVGCDVASSAIAMDKVLTKQILQASNISTTKFVSFKKDEWEKNSNKFINQINQELKYPLFIKPAHLGSSIGISRVEAKKELQDKIEVGLFYDEKIIIEEGVNNLMDVTCCVIGNNDLVASKLQESVFNAELFDFEEKYLKSGGSQFGKSASGVIIPARIDKKLTTEIQDLSKEVYKAIGCQGIARVDFLLDTKSHQIYTNEINPLPGTLYHHLWEKSGLKLDKLLTTLVELAEESHANKNQVNSSFKSSVLTNLSSAKLSSKKLQH